MLQKSRNKENQDDLFSYFYYSGLQLYCYYVQLVNEHVAELNKLLAPTLRFSFLCITAIDQVVYRPIKAVSR